MEKIKTAKNTAGSKSKKSTNSQSSASKRSEMDSTAAKQLSFSDGFDKAKNKKKITKASFNEKTEIQLPVIEIWDEEISELAITEQKLQSMRSDFSQKWSDRRKKKQYKRVCVKKPICPEGTKLMTYSVMRPAHYDAPVKPIDIKNHAGPRCDSNGIIPHSILGTVKAFKDEAQKRGEYKFLFDVEKPQVKSSCTDGVLESSSMKAWRYQNKDWHTLEQYLSETVSRPVEHLLMNTSEKYSLVQHDRNVVSTALDAEQRGHGVDRHFRSFWRQQTRMGDEIGGLFATLKKSDEGYLNAVELVDIPPSILSGKGTKSMRRHDLYPAFYTPYLDEQRENVKEIIDKIVTHQPEFDALSVVGDQIADQGRSEAATKISNCSLDVNEAQTAQSYSSNFTSITPIQAEVKNQSGPSIVVCGQSAKWEGDENSRTGQLGVITSITFDGMTDERVTGYIEIINTGSTSVYFDWKKVVKLETFHIIRSKIQRFYFFEEGGVVAPESEIKIPVIFKSPNGGVFSERWKLLTRPVLCNGADIVVVFKGVAQSAKVPTVELDLIKKKLLRHQACNVVSNIIEDLLRNVNPPEALLPVTVDYSQEELFIAENPRLIYHWSTLESMKKLYNTIRPSDCSEEFSVGNLRKTLFTLDEEDPVAEEYVLNFVAMTTNLSFHWPKPVEDLKFRHYQVGHHLLQEAVEKFADLATRCAISLKLLTKTEKVVEQFQEDKSEKKKQHSQQQQQQQKKTGKGKKKEAADPLKQINHLKTSPGERLTTSTSALKLKKSTTTKDPAVSKSTSIETFCPIVVRNLPKEKQDRYREHLYLQAYSTLKSAIMQLVDLIDGEI